MTEVVFYIFAVAAVLSAALCILQRSPVSARALAGLHHVLPGGHLRSPERAVHRGHSGTGLCRRDHGAVPVRHHAAEPGSRPKPTCGGPPPSRPRWSSSGSWRSSCSRCFSTLPGSWPPSSPSGRPIPIPRPCSSPARSPSRRRAARGVVGAVAAPLFQVYLIPFEITSILLLVAIIGAVVLAKRNV